MIRFDSQCCFSIEWENPTCNVRKKLFMLIADGYLYFRVVFHILFFKKLIGHLPTFDVIPARIQRKKTLMVVNNSQVCWVMLHVYCKEKTDIECPKEIIFINDRCRRLVIFQHGL